MCCRLLEENPLKLHIVIIMNIYFIHLMIVKKITDWERWLRALIVWFGTISIKLNATREIWERLLDSVVVLVISQLYMWEHTLTVWSGSIFDGFLYHYGKKNHVCVFYKHIVRYLSSFVTLKGKHRMWYHRQRY